jgi:hypothetical protein
MDEDPPSGPVACPKPENNGAAGSAGAGIGAAGVSTTGTASTSSTGRA